MIAPARILVATGEPSGDLHAAPMVRSLLESRSDLEVEAIGGPRLAAAGAIIRHPIDRLGALGLVEVIHHIPAHLRLLRQLRSDFKEQRYDLVITVDYPGFNLHVALAARSAGVPVLAYIAPQLWAWRPGRARRWAKAVDQLAVILPFEPGFFAECGIEATYVGHPLVDANTDHAPDNHSARRQLGIEPDAKVLALFPGSRRGEIARLWPIYRDTALRLVATGIVDRVLVAGTAEGDYPGLGSMTLLRDGSGQALAAADTALVKSGTTTLEAALAGVPMVVAYRINPLTYQLARRLVTVPWVSLVNLIAGTQIVPELVQNRVEPESLAAAIAPLLDASSSAARAQRDGLARVRAMLGGPGASNRVATMALQLLDR